MPKNKHSVEKKDKHSIEKAAFDSVKPGDVFYQVRRDWSGDGIASYRKFVVSKVNTVTFSFRDTDIRVSRKYRRLLPKPDHWDQTTLLPDVPHVRALIKEFDAVRERRRRHALLEAGVPALLHTLTKDVDKFDRFANELESLLTKYKAES